jgi:hypothetical protein
MQPKYFAGLDLGQLSDYTALAILEHVGPGERASLPDQTFHVRHLHRYPLGTSYPAIVDDVARLFDLPPLNGEVVLSVDATGVGVAVMDLFQQATRWPKLINHDVITGRPLYAPPHRPKLRLTRLHPITITGGDQVHREGRAYRVPKRDLVGAVQVGLQGMGLKIAPDLEFAETLTRELRDFRVKVSLAGHDSYGVADEWRQGQHDDLVLAVSLAAWTARSVAGTTFMAI